MTSERRTSRTMARLKLWLSRDHWALKDGCQIILGNDPSMGDQEERAKLFNRRRNPEAITYEMAVAFFEITKPGWAKWSDHINDFLVEAGPFVVWAAERNMVEEILVLHAFQIPLPDVHSETLPADLSKILAEGAKRQERCRALAQLFWEREPDLQPGQIAKKIEMISIGCEGTEYASDTIAGWIKNLAPNTPKKGRPPKSLSE